MTIRPAEYLLGVLPMTYESVVCDRCGKTERLYKANDPQNRWFVGSKTVRSVYGHHPVQVMHMCPECVKSDNVTLGITNWSPVESTQQDYE